MAGEPTPDPNMTLDQASVVTSLGRPPYIVTGYLVALLRDHFRSRDTIAEPGARHMTWTDAPDTVLAIESYARWRPELAGHRPLLLVRRNDWRTVRLGLGDEAMPIGPGGDGSTVHYVWTAGSHSLFCVTALPEEAELLGVEVYRALIDLGHLIRTDLRMNRCGVASYSAVTPLDEAHTGSAVVLDLAYAFEEGYRVRPQAPVLKRIRLQQVLGG